MVNQNQLDLLFKKLDELIQKQTVFNEEVTNIGGILRSIEEQNIQESKETKSTDISFPETDLKIEGSIEIPENQNIINPTEVLSTSHTEKTEPSQLNEESETIPPEVNVEPLAETAIPEPVSTINQSTSEGVPIETNTFNTLNTQIPLKKPFNLERFIGENLISKVGILILLIGVAIGAKYAIDNDMISPVTRVILGYLLGLGLLGFAIKLKKKYEGFSALLLGGAMATFYLITFIAYSVFDELIPQPITFVLLVFFTIFTIISALAYNREIIAHIGLIAAYSIPFLLSTGSNQFGFLFTYIAILNVGILIIAIKRYWKWLVINASAITWIIYITWNILYYDPEENFGIAFSFLCIFYLIFYASYILNKFIHKDKFAALDVILILANTFTFFGLGLTTLNQHPVGEDYLGLFTLLNATIQFVITFLAFKFKLADKNLFFLFSGLVLLFLTLTFPIQLDGGWVTMLWAGECLILFLIGRINKAKNYEFLSYPLLIVTSISVLHDWVIMELNNPTPFSTVTFYSSLIVIVFLSSIYFFDQNKRYQSTEIKNNGLSQAFSIILGLALIVITFVTFLLEINHYFDHLSSINNIRTLDALQIENISNLKLFKSIWLANYSLLFIGLLTHIRIGNKSNSVFNWLIFVFNFLFLILFLSTSLFNLSVLRDAYTENEGLSSYYIFIRYISYIFLLVNLFSINRALKYVDENVSVLKNILFAGVILWVLSSEAINFSDLFDAKNNYKFAITITWGVYSIALVAYGLWKRLKYLRITAFGLLGVTFIKMFTYDLASESTLFRAIIFVILGILMLGVSFLYNKYKNIVLNEE